MPSIITNNSATKALQVIRNIGGDLADTQNKVSSGYRVQVAADNAAYWSIATTMRSDTDAMSSVMDALALGAATADTAYTGVSQVTDLMAEIKARFVAAREPGVDKDKLGVEVEQLKAQILSIGESSTFNAENWVQFSTNDSPWLTGEKEIIGGFVRSNDNAVRVQSLFFGSNSATDGPYAILDLSDATGGEFGVLTSEQYAVDLGYSTGYVLFDVARSNSYSSPTLTPQEMTLSSATTDVELDEMLQVIDSMLLDVTDVAGTLGALDTRVSMQNEFANKLSNTLKRGVGKLVDADLNQESTRLKALQGQESLGYEALSIANAEPQSMLRLLQ
ncbi:flagellin [Rhizobium sp. SG_E_25_P2]|uniref:flagellin N-terminal helical domain-containing protein n=1 Tax=Rhizobium sp. SG_E_25_P2 TaxID=2879942 RepID=UPI002476534C|nr:flagellin [Rhizobium sp. SG_E_25_P2]MDH6267218.1 flagellin [Rhizobium sp. SG_E_25_P2]